MLPFIGVLLAVGFISAAIVKSAQGQGKRYSHLHNLAQRFSGHVVSGGWLEPASLHLESDGVPCRLSCHPGSKKVRAYTRATFQWTAPGILRLGPETFLTAVRKYFGAQDIQVNHFEFDQRFLIQGGPDAWVQLVLTPEVRAGIMELADLSGTVLGGDSLTLEIGPSGVTFQVQRCLLGTEGLAEDFLDQSIKVFLHLREHQEGEVRVLPAAEMAAEGRCPVCSEVVDDAGMHCDRCRTQHHEDCWNYFGGCAIYACASRHGKRRARRVM